MMALSQLLGGAGRKTCDDQETFSWCKSVLQLQRLQLSCPNGFS